MNDIKTYTQSEAKNEWNSARPSKRNLFLARIEKSDSILLHMAWEDFSSDERKLIHQALNEDFYSPIWYINKQGVRIFKVQILNCTKTQDELDDEEGSEHWGKLPFPARVSSLLANGIGADAEQGASVSWNLIDPKLRKRLLIYFRQHNECNAANVIRSFEYASSTDTLFRARNSRKAHHQRLKDSRTRDTQ
ncbi:hypothetical protein ACO0LB_17750 [Undibacterium sp. SXout7W]|uniref:hypothetical protein n=1 Tax=Undibacterium sp. SXout7W TaxID=3413049 RepID=UPI003BF114B4